MEVQSKSMGVLEKVGLQFGKETGEVFAERWFDLGLKGWLGLQWSDVGGKDNSALWRDSLANGGCALIDKHFLLSHPRQSRLTCHRASQVVHGIKYLQQLKKSLEQRSGNRRVSGLFRSSKASESQSGTREVSIGRPFLVDFVSDFDSATFLDIII